MTSMGKPATGTARSLNDTVKLPTFRFFSTETLISALAVPSEVVLVRRMA